MILPPPPLVLQVLRDPIYTFVGRTIGALQAERWTPTSWWRSWAHNIEVGGAAGPDAYSQHLIGTAVDLVGDPAAYDRWVSRLRAAGLIALNERTHVHAQLFPRGTLQRRHLEALRLA